MSDALRSTEMGGENEVTDERHHSILAQLARGRLSAERRTPRSDEREIERGWAQAVLEAQREMERDWARAVLEAQYGWSGRPPSQGAPREQVAELLAKWWNDAHDDDTFAVEWNESAEAALAALPVGLELPW